jgi:hypothetical protein
MKSVKYKDCFVGVSWNVDHDRVLLQITEKEEESFPDLPSQVRIKLTPEEAIEIANKLQAVAQMLILERKNENS